MAASDGRIVTAHASIDFGDIATGTWKDGDPPAINARIKTRKSDIVWSTRRGDIHCCFLGTGMARAVWAVSDRLVLKYDFYDGSCNKAGSVLTAPPPRHLAPIPCPALSPPAAPAGVADIPRSTTYISAPSAPSTIRPLLVQPLGCPPARRVALRVALRVPARLPTSAPWAVRPPAGLPSRPIDHCWFSHWGASRHLGSIGVAKGGAH